MISLPVRAFAIFIITIGSLLAAKVASSEIWINEFQFNNIGDTNEFVEIVVTNAAFAPPDLAAITVELHDSTVAGGTLYDSVTLDDESISVTSDAFASYFVWNPAEIRNNAINGIALIDISTGSRMFISWDGTFTAQDGFAGSASLTSQDVGFSQNSSTPTGQSIGLIGRGLTFADFSWSAPLIWTEGAVNEGQSFGEAVPEPGTLGLAMLGTVALITRRRRA